MNLVIPTPPTPLALVAVGAAILAACGTAAADDPAATNAPASVAPATAATTPATTSTPDASAPAAKTRDSELGPVLTDADGNTLYAFTNDVDSVSTCYGTCADAWPPLTTDADFVVGPGLDVGIFATAPRDDGTLQLVAGRFPLYTFAGDVGTADLTGHGSGDVWFAVAPDGTLLPADDEAADDEATDDDAADEATDQSADQEAGEATGEAPPVATAETQAGEVFVDVDGFSLYGFTEDVDGLPTCADACADAWPPLLTSGPELPAGLDAETFTVVERADGTHQLAAGPWPLYRFAGDGEPGAVAGQGSGGVWFLATPSGGLIRD